MSRTATRALVIGVVVLAALSAVSWLVWVGIQASH